MSERFPLDATKIRVPEPTLRELRARLHATRWSSDHVDERLGVSRTALRSLAEYWADGFDWRAAERELNRFEHYTVNVSGVPIHFMRRAGASPGSLPLVLSHGWPWTFWHWSKVADRLADPARWGDTDAQSFDVIVPSLPGFGFSTPVGDRTDLNFSKIADIFHELMTDVLGHSRYAAAGCDVGALVTGQLGHKYADSVVGIHIGSAQRLDLFSGDRAWDVTGGRKIPDTFTASERSRLLQLERRFAVHLAAHTLAPETLAHALMDSPVGMLSWLLERWDSWSDNGGDLSRVFTRDELLTHATIYWVGRGIGSSMRTYANNHRFPWAPSHSRRPVVEAPTGVTLVNFENPPGVITAAQREAHFRASDRADWYNHVAVTSHDRGGHFIPWEIPDEWVNDLQGTFRLIREHRG